MVGWREGGQLYERADRTDSLAALHALHETKAQLDWHASPYLHPYPLIAKEDRISRFREISGACEAYIEKGLIDEILFYALNAISAVKKTYKDNLDGTLLHGDVVHHNILRDRNGVIRFIDFDLASTGPAGTEIALWIHRCCPKSTMTLIFCLMNSRRCEDWIMLPRHCFYFRMKYFVNGFISLHCHHLEEKDRRSNWSPLPSPHSTLAKNHVRCRTD